jgi:hypothetical protein
MRSKASTAASRNHDALKLTENKALRTVVRELLDCYWGAGDGEDPPEFIKRAARLSGWKHKAK